ncbi:MAG: hypothetical protein N0C90_24305, partial [Candidatus Thiodiazotropha endolucinida]|nr:hypothetical protein [Candidatus Thiodiazotropha taylori]MCW4264473.1 hypothetical protein [Candidatus Thiodiazotropha endolucinida]
KTHLQQGLLEPEVYGDFYYAQYTDLQMYSPNGLIYLKKNCLLHRRLALKLLLWEISILISQIVQIENGTT